jgi:Fe-S oxidoreductase
VRGYRGFLRALLRTGSLRALRFQLQTGARHTLRQWMGRRRGDPVAEFLASYGPDGLRPPDLEARRLGQQAEACLVCGLCSIECARQGGRPPLDPRDAVVAALRLEVDWLRLGLSPSVSGACGACNACVQVCPAGIPIDEVQSHLVSLGASESPDASRRTTPSR